MSEYIHKAEFSNEVDLGRKEKVPDYVKSDDETPTKTKTYYPTLYISGVDGLGDIPKDGCALIHFRRKSLSITEGGNSGLDPVMAGSSESSGDKTTYSADLEIQSICFEEDDDEDAGDAIDAMAEKAGIKTKSNLSDDEEDDEDEEDEEY